MRSDAEALAITEDMLMRAVRTIARVTVLCDEKQAIADAANSQLGLHGDDKIPAVLTTDELRAALTGPDAPEVRD